MHLFWWDNIHEFAMINWEVFKTCNSEDKWFLYECPIPIDPLTLTVLVAPTAHPTTLVQPAPPDRMAVASLACPETGFLGLFPLCHVQEKKYYGIA